MPALTAASVEDLLAALLLHALAKPVSGVTGLFAGLICSFHGAFPTEISSPVYKGTSGIKQMAGRGYLQLSTGLQKGGWAQRPNRLKIWPYLLDFPFF